MHALRSVLASVLLAVLAVGGVVLPAAHRAAHGLEVAQAQADHADHHRDAAPRAATPDAPQAQAPCPPAPNDVDCAICTGLSAAAALTVDAAPTPEATLGAYETHADRVRAVTASGAGARAPPIG